MPNSRTIMVVDDDEEIVEMIQTALEEEGYQVVTAPNGWAAFEQLADFRPALILLDVRMPEMNGWEFAEVYRKFPGGPVPIVIVSAAPGTFEASDWMRVDGYLAKPFDVDELLAVVARYARVDA